MDWPGFEPGAPWWVKYKFTKLRHYEYTTKLTIQDMFSAFFWWVMKGITISCFPVILSPMALWPIWGSWPPNFFSSNSYFLGFSKQFIFYDVGLSVLHPTPNNPWWLTGYFVIRFLTANLTDMGDHTSSSATVSIAWWTVETHKPHHHLSRSCNS